MSLILVVDDDDDVRELIGLALADQSHDVDTVGIERRNENDERVLSNRA